MSEASPGQRRRRPIPPGLAAVLVLVRHGESTWVAERRFQGRGDPPLSARGEAQADLVARRLAHPADSPSLPLPPGPPVGLWHSPLRRAAQTAAAIAAARFDAPHPAGGRGAARLPLHPSATVLEIAQGAWEGLPASEVEAHWGARLAGWRRDPTRVHAPGGESLEQADRRVGVGLEAIMEALLAARPDRSPGPAGPPATFVPGYGQGADPQPWAVVVAHDGIFRLLLLRLLDLPRTRFWSFPFPLAGISIVEVRDGLAVLRAHGLVDHLGAGADLGAGGPALAEPGGGAAEAEAERARSGAL